MISSSNDNQLQLVLQTFEKDLQLNIRKLARFYNILCTILSVRINGRSIHADTIANSQKLTALKKEVVVRKTFDLDSRGFPPRIHDIEDIANRLLAIYDAIYVGLYWASNFVKRQPELYIRWNRPYNYQRAQCEDPEIIKV